jgi:predicted transcriptional regulator
MTSLEKRIASALVDNISASTDLPALVGEVEAAITEAAEAVRAKALDPIVSPDPANAHAAMDDAAFMRDRLRTVLPRLQQRHQELAAQEYHAQWEKNYERGKVEQDALASEFRDVYRGAIAKYVDLFTRMTACDRECDRVNVSAPAGEPRRLVGPELAARGLERFSAADPSIARELRLPDFEHSVRMAWPPPRPSMVAVFAATVPASNRRFSGDWWKDTEDGAASRRAEQQQMADYYARTTAEQEARENAEAREHFAAHQPKKGV